MHGKALTMTRCKNLKIVLAAGRILCYPSARKAMANVSIYLKVITHCFYNSSHRFRDFMIIIIIIIIIISLAYLYCASYTRMSMNESSSPCDQRRITFNDDRQRVQLALPELPAPHYICIYRLLPTSSPITAYALLPPDLLPVPI